MNQTTIKSVGCMDILGANNVDELMAHYAQDCSKPNARPQVPMYQAMESAGMLACFGAYAAEELVGFVTVITSKMPHHGDLIASIESLFVVAAWRASGLGSSLLDRASDYSRVRGCTELLYTARVASELESLLACRDNCYRSHSVFTERL